MNQWFPIMLLTIVAFFGVAMGVCAYLIYVERKLAAWMQDRVGPNRVGPFGLLQPLADGLKFLFKEEIIPRHVDKLLYLLAPTVAVGTALLAAAIVPFGPTRAEPEPPVVWPAEMSEAQQKKYDAELKEYHDSYQFVIAPNVSIGILFTFAVTSLAVYGIVLGGYASNNKYSFMGALRSSAQLISYEIPLGMSILGVILFTGSLNLEKVIDQQVSHGWNILYQPLGFLLFLIGVLAECNRLPFDLPEAEQELVGGYHTEYSALKFALFFLGEYIHVITTSLLLSIVFLGGWHFPWIAGADSPAWIKLVVILGKCVGFIIFYMLIRWTIPRFRFDQLMGLAWKVLIPLAIANLVCVAVVLHMGWSRWLLLVTSIVLVVGAAYLAAILPAEPERRGVVS